MAACLALLASTASADPDQLLARLERQRVPGFVFDYAGVIPAGERRAIEIVLAELEQKTGAQIKVVTLSSMEGGHIEDFATRLYERWGIGIEGKDEGALLLAAMEERQVRIEVGYGLESVLPDARTGRILDRFVIPDMRAGQPGRGLAAGAAALADAVAESAGIPLTGRPARSPPGGAPAGKPNPLLTLLVLIILIPLAIRHPFLFLLLLSGGRGSRGGFGGGGFGGGGFGGGGFGGGLSGGGGATRGW